MKWTVDGCADWCRLELRMACFLDLPEGSAQTYSRYLTTLKLIVAYHSCCMILWRG